MKNNKTVLVTGGAGAIGSNLVKTLLKDDIKVILLDDFSSGMPANLKDISSDKVKIVNGNICDQKTIDEAFAYGIDYVYHLAADHHQKITRGEWEGRLRRGLDPGSIFVWCFACFVLHLVRAWCSGLRKAVCARRCPKMLTRRLTRTLYCLPRPAGAANATQRIYQRIKAVCRLC